MTSNSEFEHDSPVHPSVSPTSWLAPDTNQIRVLQVEDDPLTAESVARVLRKGGFSVSVVVVKTEAHFEQQLRSHSPDVVIASHNLPSWKSMDALQELRSEGLDTPLILVSGALGEVSAAECIQRGATDYLQKDSLSRLPETIRRALQEKHQLRLHRQTAQDLARKVAELARSNAELEQFTSIASHDLQEPLRMVSAYTQLLGERYRGKLDENADKYIGYATEGAARMQSLIRDLLTLSRAGKGVCENIGCDALLEEVLLSLGPVIRESGALVRRTALPAVWAGRSQLSQVFQNLIGNAIKFRGQEAPVISVHAEKTDKHWLFSVSDNGIGIAPNDAETVFVVFQRLHTRVEYPGNGIGLAICKKIIERHDGKIWVEAQPGPGSVFKFTLPYAPLAGKEFDAEAIPTTMTVTMTTPTPEAAR